MDPLRAFLFNARSIRNKFLEFRSLVALEKPDLVAITESWMKTSSRDFEGEFAIPGYQAFHKDRTDREGGGVLLYVRDHLRCADCNITSVHELLGVDLEIGTARYRVLLVYRPPGQLVEKDRDLYALLGTLVDGRVSVVLGDFNTHVNWETREPTLDSTPLLGFVNDSFLTQWVKEPTRGDNILDLVLTTEDDIVLHLTVGEEVGGSDHRLVRFDLEAPKIDVRSSDSTKLDFRRADFDGLRTGVAGVRLRDDGDAEELWGSFKSDFMELQCQFIPRQQPGKASLRPKWLTREIEVHLRQKKAAYRSAKSSGNFQMYRELCRKVKTSIRAAKRAEEVRVARLCKENPKEFFGYVNSRKPIRKKIGPLVDGEGVLSITDAENATLLNDYFTSVFTDERGFPPEPSYVNTGPRLDFMRVTVDEVRSKIKELDKYKSPGPDGFLPRVLKEVGEEVSPLLAAIFNESLRTGCVPGDWREAVVTPIFKKGATNQPSNYRPISLTSIVGKLLEGIMVDKIGNYLESGSLLRDSQHGFRRHRSCLTNLLEFFNFVFSEHDRDKAVDVIYLDFQKAFDKVPHRRLLKKVRALGVDGEIANWIENWLKDRRQRVAVNGHLSDWAPVISGVPQGSVLGPLLFIIYINDIDDDIGAKISKFAHDTKLGANVADLGNCLLLQQDLEKVGE